MRCGGGPRKGTQAGLAKGLKPRRRPPGGPVSKKAEKEVLVRTAGGQRLRWAKTLGWSQKKVKGVFSKKGPKKTIPADSCHRRRRGSETKGKKKVAVSKKGGGQKKKRGQTKGGGSKGRVGGTTRRSKKGLIWEKPG